jgi:hypothetical protein
VERCLQIWQVAAGDCRHSQRFWVSRKRLKVGYSAPSWGDVRAGLRQPPASMMPVEYLTSAIEDRAVEALALLALHSQHRAPSVSDLLSPTRANSPR